jgi:hypothetical protein
MISHDQYLQNVEVLANMYGWCWDVLYSGNPKHPTWAAVFLEGPMEQIRRTRPEVHQYLKLPDPLPDVPLPPDGDEVLPIANGDDFRLMLERLRRLYVAAGSMRTQLAQFRPRLYASLVGQIVPQLKAVESALRVYLRWDEMEALSDKMEREFVPSAPPTPPGVPVDPAPLPDEKPVS